MVCDEEYPCKLAMADNVESANPFTGPRYAGSGFAEVPEA